MDTSMEAENILLSLAEANRKIERQTQEIYELKLSLQAKNALEKDLKEEVETLQKELDQEKKNHQENIARSKSALITDFKHKEQDLQRLLDEKSQLCEKQAEQLTKLQLSTLKPDMNELEVSVLRSELNECRQDLSSLSQDYAELQSTHSGLLGRNSDMEAQLEQAKDLLNFNEHRCEDLRQANSNLKEELERAQEDYQSIHLEIMMIKNQAQSSDEATKEAAAQGNSLFAEVEDNRQVAMHKLKEALEENIHAKEQYKVAKLELEQLRMNYISLHDEFNKIQDLNLQYMDGELKVRYEKEIAAMQKRIEDFETQALKQAPKLLPEPLAEHQWIQKLVTNHQKKVNELNCTIHEMKLQLLMNETTKMNCLRQERIAKAENLKMKGKLMDLTSKLESLENQENNVATSKANKSNDPDDVGIENIAPTAKPGLPAFLMNRKPSNSTLKFALPASGLSQKEKTKRQPYRVPTVHVPPLSHTTSQQESKFTAK